MSGSTVGAVARDGYEAQLAAGQNFDLDALLKLDEVIEQARSSIQKQEPISVQVHIVDKTIKVCEVVCKHCGQAGKYEISDKPFNDGIGREIAPKSETATGEAAKPARDGSAADPSNAPAPLPSQSCASEAEKPNAPLSASALTNVVPLPERPRNPSMAKFNTMCGYSIAKDGGLAKGPATGRIDWLAEPNPAREVAHPLPPPPPECFK
jgi:hypothetical protein